MKRKYTPGVYNRPFPSYALENIVYNLRRRIPGRRRFMPTINGELKRFQFYSITYATSGPNQIMSRDFPYGEDVVSKAVFESEEGLIIRIMKST